jgi:hypothetical protein
MRGATRGGVLLLLQTLRLEGVCRNFGISYASTQCAGCRETVMIRFHMVISGFTWLRLIMYPYVFVAGPNKHVLFLAAEISTNANAHLILSMCL